MTIEIHKSELKRLIHERMKTGEFHDVEDVLIQALQSSAACDPPFGAEAQKDSWPISFGFSAL
jgi:hypothetical protein